MAISKQKTLLIELIKTGSIKLDLMTATKQDLSAVRALLRQGIIQTESSVMTCTILQDWIDERINEVER